MDRDRLLAFALVTIRDGGDFKDVEAEAPPGGNQVSLSQFMPVNGGFEIWIDFRWDLSGVSSGVTVGTIEGLLGLDGRLTSRKVIGVVYRGSDVGDRVLEGGVADAGNGRSTPGTV